MEKIIPPKFSKLLSYIRGLKKFSQFSYFRGSILSKENLIEVEEQKQDYDNNSNEILNIDVSEREILFDDIRQKKIVKRNNLVQDQSLVQEGVMEI